MAKAHNDASVHVFAADASNDGMPIVIGVPFEKGSVRKAEQIGIAGPSGKARPVAARPLVKWGDGSVRWALLAFGATEKGEHAISVNSGRAQGAKLANPVKLTQRGGVATIDNGRVRIVLGATGAGTVHELVAEGHPYVARPEDFRLVVDEADSTREKKRNIRVMEESPTRVRVRVEGAHFEAGGKRKLNYRLDVELWAGAPTVRFDYHFFNLERGQDNLPINRMSIECDLALGPSAKRHFLQPLHSLLYVPREVLNADPVAIVSDQERGSAHVEDPAMLLDSDEYNFHVRPPLTNSSEWLGVTDGKRCAYARMQDFTQMRPKRLASRGNSIQLDVWPSRAGTLQLPQGRSRRQVLTVTFANEATLSPGEIESRTTRPFWEGRANIDPEWLARTGEFDQDRVFVRASNIRFEKYMKRLMNVASPQSWFDLGDTPDSGYLRTYIPIGNAQMLRPGAPQMERVFLTSGHSPMANWAFPEFYEPVWTNNEYDLIHALATEVMRNGMNDHWQMLRWCARHSIEVDFIHYSDHKQQHRATPQHSANHNRSGAILSHFWTQGLLEYYCMTGDADVLEVARALGDKIIEDLTDPETRKSFWGFTRELGWPTLALTHLVEVTGDKRYEKQLQEIIAFFINYDRRRFHGPLNLSSGDARYSLERQMISGFFAFACMVEGVEHYARRTNDAKARKWLVELLDDLCAAHNAHHAEGLPYSIAGMVPQGMAIGYELTGDMKYLDSGMLGLEELLDSTWWTNPPNECKPIAMTHRGLARFLYHAHKTGILQRLEYSEVVRRQCESNREH